MLEVLIPTSVANIGLVPDCLESIEQHTGIPFRVWILIDGGLREDFVNIESYLAECDLDWTLLHEQPPIYLNRAIAELAERASYDFSAIVLPHVRLDDDQWVGKWRKVFTTDARAAIVDTSKDTRSSTLSPVRAPRPPFERSPLTVMRTGFLRANPPSGDVDPTGFFFDRARATGGNTWFHPGIRYGCVSHKEHRLCRGPSVPSADE